MPLKKAHSPGPFKVENRLDSTGKNSLAIVDSRGVIIAWVTSHTKTGLTEHEIVANAALLSHSDQLLEAVTSGLRCSKAGRLVHAVNVLKGILDKLRVCFK